MVKEISTDKIWEILETIPDPEIPEISIVDLGIIRDVQYTDDKFAVTITPTYSGCPAMSFIKKDFYSAPSIKIHDCEVGMENAYLRQRGTYMAIDNLPSPEKDFDVNIL